LTTRRYTDLLGEYSAGLYGHSEPVLTDAIKATLQENGSNLGANTRHEVTYASLICERFSLDTVRFTNSGTEANLHALMAARQYTGKHKVVVFTGGYHGSVLGFSTKPIFNTIDQQNFVVVEYNNISAAQTAIERTPEVGAVLVEGMQGASGNIVGTDEFLHAVQASARKVFPSPRHPEPLHTADSSQINAVFILDEVLTSRLAAGGLRSLVGLEPDMTTLGKYLGGSLAFGALGGRREIMAVFDPRSPNALPHSGTFNNNTVTMRAGYAGLKQVYTPQVAKEHNARGDATMQKLRAVSEGTQLCFTGRGSLICSHFTADGSSSRIRSIAGLKENETLKELFWLHMMEDGFWVARRGSLALSIGVPQAELDRFVGSTKQFLARHWDEVALK
jgi:glutamate-1-semialdehyde 2,1-aminomutase